MLAEILPKRRLYIDLVNYALKQDIDDFSNLMTGKKIY
jgi:hypothetical protein